MKDNNSINTLIFKDNIKYDNDDDYDDDYDDYDDDYDDYDDYYDDHEDYFNEFDIRPTPAHTYDEDNEYEQEDDGIKPWM
jgi:hypothetical protein